MAQLEGTHGDYAYEAFWNLQDETLFWGAVVSRDGTVVGRPKGQLRRSAVHGDEAAAVRAVVESAIDEGLDMGPGLANRGAVEGGPA